MKKVKMQRFISLTLTIVMMFGLFAGVPHTALKVSASPIDTDFTSVKSQSQYNGFITDPKSDPIPADAIHISTAAQLAAIGGSQSSGKYYILDNDIYLTDEWIPIPFFEGTFNGGGYGIYNLYILESSKVSDAGLFDDLGSKVVIKNLSVDIGIEGITGSNSAGGITGVCNIYDSGLIINCYVRGNIYSDGVAGGLIGFASRVLKNSIYTPGMVSIANCYATGQVSAQTAGGLLGVCGEDVILLNCFATGDVYASYKGGYTDINNSYAGGLVGSGSGCFIVNCYTEGNVSASGTSYVFAGGLVGSLGGLNSKESIIENCYTVGQVSSSTLVEGGLIGWNGNLLTFKPMCTYSAINSNAIGTAWGFSEVIGMEHVFAVDYTGDIEAEIKITAKFIENNEIEATWNPVSGADKYTVSLYRSPIGLDINEFVETIDTTDTYYNYIVSESDFVNIYRIIVQAFDGETRIGLGVYSFREDDTEPPKSVIKGEFQYFYDEKDTDGNITKYDNLRTIEYEYTDDFFRRSAVAYDHKLALMSMKLCLAATDMTQKKAYSDGEKNALRINKNQIADEPLYEVNLRSSNIANCLKDIGFDNFAANYGYLDIPTENSIGASMAMKDVEYAGEKYTLLAVGIRGFGYGSNPEVVLSGEWAGNFNVGVSGFHAGFAIARDQVIDMINAYINYYKISQRNGGNLKIWITGYSRAAATANLVAGALNDGIAIKDKNITLNRENIYARCFECPAGVPISVVEKKQLNYYNIHNFINPYDPVTKVAPANWGFFRYGVDLHFPAESTNKEYPALKKNMLSLYRSFGGKGILNDTLTGIKTIDVYLDSFINKITAMRISRFSYAIQHQHQIVQNIKGETSETEIIKIIDFIDMLSKIIGLAVSYPADAGILINLNTTLVTPHEGEMTLAWLEALTGKVEMEVEKLEGGDEYSFIDKVLGKAIYIAKYRYLIVNCPVDVEVYDSGNMLAAAIYNDIPQEIEGGLASALDENRQKIIYLPADEEYTIKITAAANGKMTYSVQEFDRNESNVTRVVNYYEIEIQEGDKLTGVIENLTEESNVNYTLIGNDDEEIEPSEDLNGTDEVETYEVNVEITGNGSVTGEGTRIKGEFAMLTAYPAERERFSGWYKDGEAISSDINYRFCVLSDTTFEARFETAEVIKGDLNGDGKADIEDAKVYLESLVGNTTFTTAQEEALEGIVPESDSAIKQLRTFLTVVIEK